MKGSVCGGLGYGSRNGRHAAGTHDVLTQPTLLARTYVYGSSRILGKIRRHTLVLRCVVAAREACARTGRSTVRAGRCSRPLRLIAFGDVAADGLARGGEDAASAHTVLAIVVVARTAAPAALTHRRILGPGCLPERLG